MFDSKIYVAGHTGMVGSAVVRRLNEQGCPQLITQPRSKLDLTDQQVVRDFFRDHRPDMVILAAAKVGGIHANRTFPADFIYQNLSMAIHVIHAAYQYGASRLLFLGSTCIYPRLAAQPLKEHDLLSSSLEPTNEAYAIAKIAGLKMCQYYRSQYGVTFHSAMPTNLYGPGDNYHAENSHVLPALIRRFHQAKQNGDSQVSIWGTGRPRREFLHVDDLADAILHLISLKDPPDWVNVGTGIDISIRDLASLVAEIVGYTGSIFCDTSQPDGTPVKRTDISLIRSTGWSPQINLRDGIKNTYDCYLQNLHDNLIRET